MRSVESSYVKSLAAEQETAADLIFALKLQEKKEEGIIFQGFLFFCCWPYSLCVRGGE